MSDLAIMLVPNSLHGSNGSEGLPSWDMQPDIKGLAVGFTNEVFLVLYIQNSCFD